jgi:hypothetical protein
VLHLLLDGWVARYDGMPLVQALSCDFTRMIDTHQAGCVTPLRVV